MFSRNSNHDISLQLHRERSEIKNLKVTANMINKIYMRYPCGFPLPTDTRTAFVSIILT